jgi:hypothetical protein
LNQASDHVFVPCVDKVNGNFAHGGLTVVFVSDWVDVDLENFTIHLSDLLVDQNRVILTFLLCLLLQCYDATLPAYP